jgi:hypothetical protein
MKGRRRVDDGEEWMMEEKKSGYTVFQNVFLISCLKSHIHLFLFSQDNNIYTPKTHDKQCNRNGFHYCTHTDYLIITEWVERTEITDHRELRQHVTRFGR